jgi:Reductase C-terminal
VIEPGLQAMGRSLLPEIAAWLADWHRENGVALRFGVGVREVTAGRLLGVVGIDAPRDVRAGQKLIRTGQPVNPALLADISVSAQLLARAG